MLPLKAALQGATPGRLKSVDGRHQKEVFIDAIICNIDAAGLKMFQFYSNFIYSFVCLDLPDKR